MRTTSQQNRQFAESILPTWPLDEAIEWINSNMEPGDVFTEDKLEEWAENNGFTKGL
jgi:hypothetical protein